MSAKENGVTGTIRRSLDATDNNHEPTVEHAGQGSEKDELLRPQHNLRLRVLENAEQIEFAYGQSLLKALEEALAELNPQILIRAYQCFFKHRSDSRNCARDL